MPLSLNTQLGSYQILGPLGVGGMGEVYRARDTKLGSEVALKVLPEQVAQDRDRLARFTREAQLLASLNHPNIAAIYGVEEAGGSFALVLEYVDGETLAERINKKPIPIGDVLRFGLQMSQALEAAHERTVVHRDLKPANVKITSEGKIKVLDFGLAKAMQNEDGASPNLSQSPTISVARHNHRRGIELSPDGRKMVFGGSLDPVGTDSKLYPVSKTAAWGRDYRSSDIRCRTGWTVLAESGDPAFNGRTEQEDLPANIEIDPELER